MEISNKSYITIQGFMVSELGLKGNELLAYAIIYGFSQDGETEFIGSANYIASWIGCTRQTATNILNDLAKRELIIKTEKIINGVKFCNYRSNLHPVKNFDTPPVKKSDTIYIDIHNTSVINIVEYLNKQCGTNYKHSTKKTRELIKARLNEGYTEGDFYTVIDKKVAEWKGTEFEQYLRPETLFGTKFESYLNQNVTVRKGVEINAEQRETIVDVVFTPFS